MKRKQLQSGQVLLITIMLLATVLTVVVSLGFRSSTETQITKLEEDSQQALGAAEAGIEAALQKNSTGVFSGSDLGIGLTNVSVSLETVGNESTTYVTPLLRKDEMYTFYTSDYNRVSNSFTGVNANTAYTIYYQSSGSCNTVSLDITVMNGNAVAVGLNPAYTYQKYIADAGSLITATNSTNKQTVTAGSYSVQGTTFLCKVSVPVDQTLSPRYILVRLQGANVQSKLGFEGTQDLSAQGRSATSTGSTNTGVQKKVQLIQTNPQIPADFFYTSL